MAVPRPIVYLCLLVMMLLTALGMGSYIAAVSAERRAAQSQAQVAWLRGELAGLIDQSRTDERATGTVGRAEGLSELKRQIQAEMGLFPVKLLRQRRASFGELNADDNRGRMNYGTAGYLGQGYFITVKHGVIALNDEGERGESRRIVSIRIKYNNKMIPAEVVDAGALHCQCEHAVHEVLRLQRRVARSTREHPLALQPAGHRPEERSHLGVHRHPPDTACLRPRNREDVGVEVHMLPTQVEQL